MIHPELAVSRILEGASPLCGEHADLRSGLGRVLVEDVTATQEWPPFDYAPGHGYALLTGDVEAASGDRPVPLELASSLLGDGGDGARRFPGRAVPVEPGGPVPEGAEAVVAPQEVRVEGGRIRVADPVSPGARIRRRGIDVIKGELLFEKGTRLRASDLAVLAGQGLSSVHVVRRARVAIVVAGAGSAWTAGGADRHAVPALGGALEGWGAAVEDRGQLPTAERPLREALAAAIDSCDVLVLAGGLAETCREGAAAGLLALGLEPEFWGVAIEPGAGLFFGRLRGRLVFGLPGPAAAAMLCLEEFARGAIDRLHGREPSGLEYAQTASLDGHLLKDGARQVYLFGQARRTLDGWGFRPLVSPRQGLSRGANAVARIPIGPTRLPAGTEVSFRWI